MAAIIFAVGVPLQVDERFVRASGPGGQKVNKVATATELRFDVHASALPADVRARLLSAAGRRLTSDGVVLIDSREFRTQAQNRAAARDRLIALVERAFRKPKKRTPTRPGAGARERRLITKKIRSAVKRTRTRRPPPDE